MPGWYEQTKQLAERGLVQTVGIIQEQHPDRARLFMQWKQMDWPILVDSQNQLGVAVVPITLLIDEYGIIRNRRPPRTGIAEFVEQWVGEEYESPSVVDTSSSEAPNIDELRKATENGTVDAWRAYGQSLVNWGGADHINEAIDALGHAVQIDPGHGLTEFQLGVAYRKRYDSVHRQRGDFQSAVDHWGLALAIDPNQYIWRRRIQQYGPRLMKPYPFYDWVHTAREEIMARGETPSPLIVEPGGAEFAQRERSFSADDTVRTEPESADRIHRDKEGFILAEATVVPGTANPGAAVRIHLSFIPNQKINAHWNNEAQPMQLWVSLPKGWEIDRQFHTIANAETAVSLETRVIEFELHVPADAAPGPMTIRAYALYNVCEGENGVCLYRRHDVEIQLDITESSN